MVGKGAGGGNLRYSNRGGGFARRVKNFQRKLDRAGKSKLVCSLRAGIQRSEFQTPLSGGGG